MKDTGYSKKSCGKTPADAIPRDERRNPWDDIMVAGPLDAFWEGTICKDCEAIVYRSKDYKWNSRW